MPGDEIVLNYVHLLLVNENLSGGRYFCQMFRQKYRGVVYSVGRPNTVLDFFFGIT